MMHTVQVSKTFYKQFYKLPKKVQKQIRSALKKLEENPIEPRTGANIKPLIGTKPQKHRIRVGDYRIIYLVDKKAVNVIEVFKRGRGYRK